VAKGMRPHLAPSKGLGFMSDAAVGENHEFEEVGSESDAPTERMALYPELNFKSLQYTSRSTKKLTSPVIREVPEWSKTRSKEKTKEKVKLPYREFNCQSSQTVGHEHKRSRRYKFVHSDDRVDIVTDMLAEKPNQKQSSKRDRRNQSEESDGGDYLTPSEDSVGVSHVPVSPRQVIGLKRQREARMREFGEDTMAKLPVYYSSGSGHNKSGIKGTRTCSGQKEVPRQPLTTNTRTYNRNNMSPSDSSSSDGKYYDQRGKSHQSKKGGHQRKGDSSKENESEDDKRPFVSSGSVRQMEKEEKRWKPRSFEPTKTRRHKKGYMKPEKYDGTTCFETFLMQFSNCADYNEWAEHEKLVYLKWCLKGSAAQMLWGSNDVSYRSKVK